MTLRHISRLLPTVNWASLHKRHRWGLSCGVYYKRPTSALLGACAGIPSPGDRHPGQDVIR
jgi:hypothetical protein